METDLARKLDEQALRLEAIYISVEKTRKYFLTSLMVTLALVILPIIGLLFAIPQVVDDYAATQAEFEGLLE